MIAQAVKVHRLIQADKQRLVDENTHLRQELKERYDFSNLVGTSGPMHQVYEQIAQVARTNTTVLLRGESGTGKELIAHAIHYNSLRSKKPFVKVSCGALPDTLIESELFGYEKGAFTGALDRKKGRFDVAQHHPQARGVHRCGSASTSVGAAQHFLYLRPDPHPHG